MTNDNSTGSASPTDNEGRALDKPGIVNEKTKVTKDRDEKKTIEPDLSESVDSMTRCPLTKSYCLIGIHCH